MLVSTQVVYNSLTILAKDHICIKAACDVSSKGSNPGYCFATVLILVRVILNCERYSRPLLREHDSSPTSDIKEWHGVRCAMPNFVHYSGADASFAKAICRRRYVFPRE